MKKKNFSSVDAFIEEAENGRTNPLSKEDIKRINELSKEVEIEDDVISIVVKEKNDSESEKFRQCCGDSCTVFGI